MAIRTINSPGVQITERDLSQYTNGAVGTAVLVTGFASKGRDYEPILLTSRSAWLQQFGEPTSEAERYFFNACMEVINQGGKLYACKLPYKNEALNQFVTKTYTVNVSKLQELSTVKDYVVKNHLDRILAGDYTDFGEGVPGDDATSALFQVERTVKAVDDLLNDYRIDNTQFNYVLYSNSAMGVLNYPNKIEDNWMLDTAKDIYTRLSAMFSVTSKFTEVLPTVSAKAELSGFFNKDGYQVPLSIDFTGFSIDAGVSANIDKFAKYVVDALGGDPNTKSFKIACDPASGINTLALAQDFPTFEGSNLQLFLNNNLELFNAIAGIPFNYLNDSEDLDVKAFVQQMPYFYCNAHAFNAGSYYNAITSWADVAAARDRFDAADAVKIVNETIDVDDVLTDTSLSDTFALFFERLGPPPVSGRSKRTSYWQDSQNDLLKTKLTTVDASTSIKMPLDVLAESYAQLIASPEYSAMVEDAKRDLYQDTPFAKTVLQYYIDNTPIANDEYKSEIRIAKNLNIFYKKFDADTLTSTSDDMSTLFELYNGPESSSPELSSVTAVINGAVSQMRYDDFLKYSRDFVASDDFARLSGKAAKWGMEGAINALLSDNIVSTLAFSEIKLADPTVDKYLTIDSRTDVALKDLETIDGYATGETPVRPNTFVIVDKTRGTLGTAFTKGEDGMQKEVVGVIPVVTTAANALYVQALLETGDSGITKYNAIKTATTLANANVGPFEITDADAAIPFMSDNAGDYTVSQIVAGSFPSIHFDSDGHMDRQNLKKIGIVVLRAFLDPGEGNRVNYDVVEAFAGELDKNAVDPNTGATAFIDNLINAQSEYIEFYSNCFNQTDTRKKYSEMDLLILNEPQKAGSLGFYDYMTKKNISLTDSIMKALPLVWEKNEDINEKAIDVVCDAGVSNIAQYVKSCFNGRAGEYDPASEVATMFKLRSKEDTKTWRAVLDMYDNFCKNIRKDCMFVADGPRPFCLTGNKKIVRPSKPSNTVDGAILPMLKYITGVNTNYGAGYCDWFQKADEFSGDYFWCPPSIQAMGVYLNTDINFDYWMAPAGLNRGIVSAIDVAFNPTQRQADEIYPKCWNYARNYPNDGIVLEGQRTFQTKPTALDRVNVRRAMLRFERMTYEIARWYVYENNTTYTRQRFYDALDGVFKEIKGQGGLIDYKIICDESINTPEVIDRNELRVKIGIKPVKSIEFILIEFNILRQGGSWTEML